MNRRQFITYLGAGLLNTACGHVRFDGGVWNPCLDENLPPHLAQHDLVLSAWEGLDMQQVWDCHTHLVGTGDSDSGIWVNPDMQSLWHPVQRLQWQFYMNATCLEDSTSRDEEFVQRLLKLQKAFPAGYKSMLLAFDYQYDQSGRRLLKSSNFYIPNDYAARIAKRYQDDFEWIASIHPYRKDSVSALDAAVAKGTKAIKWLPPVMGIDPSSPLCDDFYQALIKHKLPLLCHAGKEKAVQGGETAEYGNPLLLRRPLDQGVKVIVAHCGSLGEGIDLDKGKDANELPSFNLFSRLMDEKKYESLLFGDISALIQVNRVGSVLNTVIQRQDWHPRLINGSDYPLPGVIPIISIDQLVDNKNITASQGKIFSAIREHNPMLFDFVVKRHLSYQGLKFSDQIFETKRLFTIAADD